MLRTFRHMLRHALPYWRFYLVGTTALVLVDTLDTFTPKLTQWAIDHLTALHADEPVASPVVSLFPASWFGPDAYLGGLWLYGVLLVALVSLTGFFRYPMSIYFTLATLRLTHDLRGRLFSHLQRLDASWHDHSKVGDHMSLATNDTDAVRMFYGVGLLILLDTALYFLLVPAYMISISWKLMLACVATLPLIPLIVARLTHTVERRYEAVQEQFATVSERARESYAGARVVKSFAREDSEVRSFSARCREYFGRYMHFAWVLAVEHPALVLLLGLVDLVVVFYGGALYLRGEITVGEFQAFFQYLIRLSGPMIGLGWTLMLYQRGCASMRRLERVLEVEPRITEPARPAPLEDLRGEVEIRDLTFAFTPEGPRVLRDLSLHLPPGGTLGIVGPVGSGKSALLGLLPRLYDPPPGTVRIDGHDVQTIDLALLRGRIAAVPQETFLFSATIGENIALGIPDGRVDTEIVEACARLAHLDQEIQQLPRGYATLLGERGVNLSGGQKQRVALARALARRPALLLLDDCLSAVDTETEAAILRGLRGALEHCTVLIASHRVSALLHADEIIVLQEGSITERGKHEQLVARGGYYAELHRKQQLERQLEDGA